MKKMLFKKGLCLMIILFSFSGCSGSPQDENQQHQASQNVSHQRRSGIIQSLGGAINNQASHLLKQEDGSTILLQSDSIKLSENKYLQKKVEVSGLVTKTNDDNEIMDVMSIDILDISEALSVEPTWKDYKNNQFKIGFKYRSDFTINEQHRSIQMNKASDSTDKPEEKLTVIVINIIPHLPDATLLKFLNVESDSSKALVEASLTKTQVGKNLLSALKKEGVKETHYYLDHGNNFYEIILYKDKVNGMTNVDDFFKEFLGSIILENDETAITETETDSVTETNISSQNTDNDNLNDTNNSKEVVQDDNAINDLNKNESTIIPKDTTTSQQPADTANYESFESTSFKFAIQYPKGYYFGNADSSDNKIIRRYEFGEKPLEESSGDITLDLISESVPQGSKINVGNNTLVQNTENGTTYIYVQGAGKRVYRLSGPESKKNILLNMAGTLEEK